MLLGLGTTSGPSSAKLDPPVTTTLGAGHTAAPVHPRPALAAVPASALVAPNHIQWEMEVKVSLLLTLKSEARSEAFW